MKFFTTLLLAVVVALTVAACAGHGPSDEVNVRWHDRTIGGGGGADGY